MNSLPKAGTHLVAKFIDLLPDYIYSGVHIQTWKVNLLAKSPEENICFAFDAHAFRTIVNRINNGQYFSSHLPWDNTFREMRELNLRYVVLVRDPRDLIVSDFFYIKGLRRHFLHDAFVRRLASDDERIRALIVGSPNVPGLRPIGCRLESFRGWLAWPEAAVIRFEDLIAAKRNPENPTSIKTMQALLGRLEIGVDDSELRQILTRWHSRGSFTLRRGVAGGWRELLNERHLAMLKEAAGEEMEAYGYGF